MCTLKYLWGKGQLYSTYSHMAQKAPWVSGCVCVCVYIQTYIERMCGREGEDEKVNGSTC